MITFLIVALIAAGLLYAVMLGASPQARRPQSRGRGSVNAAEIRPRWEAIMATSRSGASGLKSAIAEADKLFDYAMKQLGYPGETFADRLKVAQRELSDREAVWRAHKLRNALAHEIGFDLVVAQANDALRGFERGLKDLGAL
jgi:hypothetical protein